MDNFGEILAVRLLNVVDAQRVFNKRVKSSVLSGESGEVERLLKDTLVLVQSDYDLEELIRSLDNLVSSLGNNSQQ